MAEVRFTSEIAAPLGDVFAAHVDGPRIPEWFPGVQAIEDQAGPLDRAGTTYRLRFSRLVAGQYEVVTVDPPRYHERTWNSKPFGSAGRVMMRFFEAAPGRTRIDFHARYELPGGPLGRVVEALPPVRRRAERDMRREIDSFKDFVERGARGAG
jgi:uncharacterized protein YndB with AHSA1/START domain